MVSPANDPSHSNEEGPEGAQPENPLDSSTGASSEVVETSFSDQSYTSKYGSRYRYIHLGIGFEREDRATTPAGGGDRQAFIDAQKKLAAKTESAIRTKIAEAGVEGEFQNIRFSISGGMIMAVCSAKGADTLLSIVSDRRLTLVEDATSMYAFIPEDLTVHHAVWEDGAVTPHFEKIQTAGVDSYGFIFEEGQTVPDAILSEIETVLQDNDLVGTVGVNLAHVETGNIILTCIGAELELFTGVTGLTKIEMTTPEVISGGGMMQLASGRK